MEKLVSIGEAAAALSVCIDTLRRWDKNGKLQAVKTTGGHRRYRLSDIERLQGLESSSDESNIDVVAQYSRVSSHDQKEKGDLDRQTVRLTKYCAEKGYKVGYILTDVGSGMSNTRSRLKQLFSLVEERKITKVIIEHKDRLTRFNYGVYERFFSSYGVAIEHVGNKGARTYEQELVDDMISLMSSFSARIYGKRSAENRRKRKIAAQARKETKTSG